MPGNPNLGTGSLLPGIYGYVDYNAGGSQQPPNLRALIWGYVSATAIRTPNVPFRPANQTEANQGCGGANTDAARGFAAGVSQPEGQGADIWIMPIQEPSGGVQSTYKLKMFVTSTNPSKAGTLQLWICSQQLPSVGFGTTDTASTIATAVAAAINSMTTIPCTATVATDTVTITYIHKGQTGEDLPIRAQILPKATGFNISPAQAIFATNATGAGSVVITVGAITVTTTLAGGETPAQVATKVAASWTASTYPVTAVVDSGSTSTVDFYMQDLFDVRRMSAAIVTSTGLTVNLGSGATSGTGSASSLSYDGTQGTGLPSVATAIANLTAMQQWWRSWMSPWVDLTTLGSLATYIEAASSGGINGQKLQTLTMADWQSLTVDTAIPIGVSPNLTTTPPHYAFGWSPDAPVQTLELAARVACARAALWIGQPQKNWNGFRLQGNPSSAPILGPAITSVPSKDTLNSALRSSALSPWVLGPSGNIEVVKGRTTSLAADLRLWAWSAEAQASYHQFDLTNFFAQRFNAVSIVRFTDPKAAGIVDAQSFKDATAERMRFWDDNGNYDGAALLSKSIVTGVDPNNPSRMNVDFPESPVVDLDQVAFSGHFTAPSS